MPYPKPSKFSQAVISWTRQHGRQGLPWQEKRTPYRVWLSEIMLQQTQVATVIPYFNDFITSYPEIADLAQAPIDEVLGKWSGLGYYARARNLHRCAQQICQEYQGEFPADIAALITLPGIGRSTAGAIRALGFDQPATILDGNVKRVLCRTHKISEPINKSQTMKQLWEISEKLTPKSDIAIYTQGIMDIGATLCTRSNVQCPRCPLQSQCLAYQDGVVSDYPRKIKSKEKPTKDTLFLICLTKRGYVLLEKRPDKGIWGGLWSFPELAPQQSIRQWCSQRIGGAITRITKKSIIKHTFSHYHLQITPVIIELARKPRQIKETDDLSWYDLSSINNIGLSKPVNDILQSLPA